MTEKLRARWGCDAPARDAVFETSCPRCDGGDADCKVCGGTGQRRLFRCPAVLAREGWVIATMDAYYALDRFGTWPADGGFGAQSPWFISAVRLIENERGKITLERNPAGGGK